MPKNRSYVNSEDWISFDAKKQSNSKELITLVKTIDGVQVKEQNGTVYVCFPKRKAKPSVKATVSFTKPDKAPHSFSRDSIQAKEPDTSHHYCAIMLKKA